MKNREKPITILGNETLSIENYKFEFDLFFIGRSIPLTQQYAAMIGLCIPLLILVGAGSAIFWILGNWN